MDKFHRFQCLLWTEAFAHKDNPSVLIKHSSPTPMGTSFLLDLLCYCIAFCAGAVLWTGLKAQIGNIVWLITLSHGLIRSQFQLF